MPTHYEELRDGNKMVFFLQDLVISQEWSDTYTHKQSYKAGYKKLIVIDKNKICRGFIR